MSLEPAWPVGLAALGPIACGAVLWRHRGTLRVTIVAKATFALVHGGQAALVAPIAVTREEARFEQNPMRSVRAASDLALYRPRVDVTATGHACAPEGRPIAAMSVRLALYRGAALLDKTLHVFGDRAAQDPARVAPFERIPLRYERAYGGLLFEKNPLGLGAGRDATALPNLVDPADPTRVGGFGPISSYARERRRLLGEADRKRLEGRIAEVPDAFAWEYYQDAPEDQRVAALKGDEWIVLDGMHPALPRLQTQLPGVRAAAHVYPGGAEPVREFELVADTLAIDVDGQRCFVVWRGAFPRPDGEPSLAGLSVAVGLEGRGAAIAWPDPAEIKALAAEQALVAMPAATRGPANLARTVDEPEAAGLEKTVHMDDPLRRLAALAPVVAPAPVPAPVPAPAPRPSAAPVPTLWRRQAVWRGDIDPPDRLRIEARDGTFPELRLEPVGVLRLGRIAGEGDERNELVFPEIASRFAATLRHDGVRWWLRRRPECSVPISVGARPLERGEEAPLVHAAPVIIGDLRAVLFDRRYLTPAVAADTVDPVTGLLGRAGLELEIGCFLERTEPGAILVVRPRGAGLDAEGAFAPAGVLGALAVHRRWPTLALGVAGGSLVILAPGRPAEITAATTILGGVLRGAGLEAFACGIWPFAGGAPDAARELELALSAIRAVPEGAAVALREVAQRARIAAPDELAAASTSARRATLLFAIEEQTALREVGPQVLDALEGELAAVIAGYAGAGALVAPLAPGVVAACVPQGPDVKEMASRVLCDWHARPPVTDGMAELSRSLSWELLHAAEAKARAAELSRESADSRGVLSALSGGLPYPISGLVHAAMSASSAVERVKMLFDVLEGTWRFMATIVLSAALCRPTSAAAPPEPLVRLARRLGTRTGYPLGTWRELARTGAAALDAADPIAATAREVLEVKLGSNQTFETLSNLMQAERNGFAHGHTTEARAAADLPAFEQMTRTFLRALRPLRAWTLVTVEKTDPDPYGDSQTVEYIDHTGPYDTGVRRRIGLSTPVRLAHVVYLARWREGLVLPLEPLIRRVAHEERYDLYWMDHLPAPGVCHLSGVLGGQAIKVPFESLRVPPPMRALIEEKNAK